MWRQILLRIKAIVGETCLFELNLNQIRISVCWTALNSLSHTHQMYCIQCTQVDCIYFIFLCFVWIELVLQFKYFYLFPEHSTGKTIVWCSSKFVPNKRKREIVETLKSSAYFSNPFWSRTCKHILKLTERQLFPLKVQCERPAEELFSSEKLWVQPKMHARLNVKVKITDSTKFLTYSNSSFSTIRKKRK